MYFKDIEALKAYFSDEDLTNREWLVYLADQSYTQLEKLTQFCNYKKIDLIGGIYSGLLVEDRYLNKGLIVLDIKTVFKTKVLPHLMRSCNILDQLKDNIAIVVADGLSPQFKALTDTIYNKLGSSVTYVGGGAGYYDMIQRPCIFDNKGIYQDIAIIAVLENEGIVHYKHGWERLEGPFIINKALDNVLSEIDYEPAFDFYRDIFLDHENIYVPKENFFNFSKEHPFGIDLGQKVDIVRDPISITDSNEIVCVADIPEQRDLYILEGNVNTLLQSSLEVAKECSQHNYSKYIPLLFDCISRAIYLEDDFNKELSNIQSAMDEPVYGALSIGEISSLDSGEIQIHNKSTVLAVVKV